MRLRGSNFAVTFGAALAPPPRVGAHGIVVHGVRVCVRVEAAAPADAVVAPLAVAVGGTAVANSAAVAAATLLRETVFSDAEVPCCRGGRRSLLRPWIRLPRTCATGDD